MNHSKWYMRCHLKSLVCAILCVRAQFYAIVILVMNYFPFLLTIVADSEKITDRCSQENIHCAPLSDDYFLVTDNIYPFWQVADICFNLSAIQRIDTW